MLLNCGAGENCWESLGQQGDQSILKEINLDCGSTAAEAEAAMLQPPGANSQLIEKGPDAGKDWRQKMKGATEDEMVR